MGGANIPWGEVERDPNLPVVEVNALESPNKCVACLYSGHHWCRNSDSAKSTCVVRAQLLDNDGNKEYAWKDGKCEDGFTLNK